MTTKRARDVMKHEAIAKAATRLFLRGGYSSTSMDAVAEAARVTKQTVYAHYQNKDALFAHMVATLCDRHTPSESLLKDNGQPVDALLHEIGLGFLNMITSTEGIAATRLVVAEVHRNPKLAQRFYEGGTQRMISMLAQFLKRQNKRGTLNVPDPESAASYFFAMLKGKHHLRMMLGIKPTPTQKEKEAHAREVVHMFIKLYGDNL